MRIYLDYNATTPLDPRVREAMLEGFSQFGNPSSIHAEGREARALVDEARVRVARSLNCDHRQFAFTSGGTEANNLAILGSARANRSRGLHIVTTSIEHSAILNPCRQLEREGFNVTYVPPTSQGLIEVDTIRKAIRADTILISVMMANNEIGTIQPVREIAAAARERQVLFHTDAIQAYGKIPVDIGEIKPDLLSISAHKIYGPKGAGALYHAPHVEIEPLVRGGTHEQGLRAGTENVPAIHGFGVAAQILTSEGLPELMSLRTLLEKGLESTGVIILCRDALRLPNTINLYHPAWIGESMVMAFDLEGIAVSNGSACSAGIIEPSHVIQALGYNVDVSRSVIRVSFGKYTTEGEVRTFLRVVQQLERTGSGVSQ
jgi:cysteine desulfurase